MIFELKGDRVEPVLVFDHYTNYDAWDCLEMLDAAFPIPHGETRKFFVGCFKGYENCIVWAKQE